MPMSHPCHDIFDMGLFYRNCGGSGKIFCSSVKESPRLVKDRGICLFGRLGNDGAGLEQLLVGGDDLGLHLLLKFPVEEFQHVIELAAGL